MFIQEQLQKVQLHCIGPLAGMEPVTHDLAARARQLESLARMSCLILEISSIKKPSTLSSID
jgi:hypothetical protein